MNADDVVADIKSKMTERKVRRYSEPGRRGIRRPEEILRDVRGLKLRQRVSLVLGDDILREELEETIRNSTVNGVMRLDTIRTYQDFLLPLQPNFVTTIGKGYGGGSASTVLPINDIRGQGTLDYSKSERALRCKLAAVYRLVDIFGWSEAIFNHISVRPSPKNNAFLLNPFGLLFNEVSAASLVKCDVEGNLLDGGSTCLGINRAGFVLHSTIHEARPDIYCIIHVHTPTVVAVASMKCGFLRISQESLIVGGVSYHDYWGILIDEAEKESIKEDLGPENMVMFLRNHGVVVCGKNIEDAFMLLVNVMDACEAQVKAISVGLENLNIISEEAYLQVQEVVSNAAKNIIKGEKGKPKMTMGEYYFEAYMRWLDSQGYRTGYTYHLPDIFISGESPKKIPESRIPPQVTSDRDAPYHMNYDYQPSPVHRAQSMGRGNTHRNRVKWLNSPVQGTQYRKEERQESATPPATSPETEEKVTNDLVNGHAEEIDELSEILGNDVKVVTKTATVTETKVGNKVTSNEEKVEKIENVVVVNGDGSSHDINLVHSSGTQEPPPSPSKSNNSLQPPSEEGSTADHLNEEGLKSPTKVKKQKSFKKALMKKFHKKEEKKEEKAK